MTKWYGLRNVRQHVKKIWYTRFSASSISSYLLFITREKKNIFKRLREEISKASKSKQAFDKAETRYFTNLRITNPRYDKKRIETAKGGLLKDLYRWVLSDAQFQQ